MYISKIEECNKKYAVYLDEEYAFSLYKSEIKRYMLVEQKELSDEEYNRIIDEVVYKRAKERALFLLERRPYTSYKLKTKLREGRYPSEVIERVMEFLEKYRYVDDYEYARMYIESYYMKKSRKAMMFDLQQKGITKEITSELIDNMMISDKDSLSELIEKYIRGKDLRDPKTRDKIIRHFMGKGYSFSNIKSYLDENTNLEEMN